MTGNVIPFPRFRSPSIVVSMTLEELGLLFQHAIDIGDIERAKMWGQFVCPELRPDDGSAS